MRVEKLARSVPDRALLGPCTRPKHSGRRTATGAQTPTLYNLNPAPESLRPQPHRHRDTRAMIFRMRVLVPVRICVRVCACVFECVCANEALPPVARPLIHAYLRTGLCICE